MSSVLRGCSRLGEQRLGDTDTYRSRTESYASVVPRQDPVRYDQGTIWETTGNLTEDELRVYDERGYLVLDELFDPIEIRCLQNELARLRTDAASIEPETLVTEPGGHELRSIFRIHEQSTILQRLAHDARLVGIAQRILGDEVYVHQSRLNYKPGFSGKEFYWHSDFETWHVEDGMPRMRALSMSLALTENTEFNGPLMLMPGSHRHYVRCVGETPAEHYKQSLRKQEYGVPDPTSLASLFVAGGIVAPVGAPGRLVVFDCNLMHGSNSNISPLPRSNVFLVYNALSNRLQAPFGGTSPRPEFLAARSAVRPVMAIDGHFARE